MDVAVVVDFDGTVTEGAVSLMLLERFAPPAWRDLDREFEAGQVNARECIARQFEMLEASDEDIREFARDHAKLRPGFLEFVSHLRGLGFPLAITSEGLDLYIDPVIERDRIDYVSVFSNEAKRTEGGRISVRYPHADMDCDDCGNCKSGLVEALKADGNYVVFVGNGRTDLCPAKKANLVFARDELARDLQSAGRPFILFEDFFDIMEAWDSVVAHG
jgi:2-hydroxy-3-keto-5-methylthiopentenyl-1-phosphate phosphatase